MEELKTYVSSLFSGAEITVRDRESQEILTQLGYSSTIQGDPVFDFIPQKKHIQREKKTIGIALRVGFLDNSVVNDIVR